MMISLRHFLSFLYPVLALARNIDNRDLTINRIVLNEESGMTSSLNFASYSFAASFSSDSIRILTGMPNTIDPSEEITNGSIIECSSYKNNSIETSDWLSNITCQSTEWSDMLSNELKSNEVLNFHGATLMSSPTNAMNSSTVVCFPLANQNCPSRGTLLPGECFFVSHNNTARALDEPNELECFSNTVDILFLVDGSSSISPSEFNLMRTALVEAVAAFSGSIGISTRIAVIQYYDRNRVFMYKRVATFGSFNSVESLQESIRNNLERLRGSNTYTAAAIRDVVNTDFANSQNADKKVLILVTDGDATDSSNLLASYQLTQANNITVYAVGVDIGASSNQLDISAGSPDRVFYAQRFDDLRAVLESLTQEIAPPDLDGTISYVSGTGSNQQEVIQRYPQTGISGHWTNDLLLLSQIGDSVVRYSYPDGPNYVHTLTAGSALGVEFQNSNLGYAVSCGYYEGGETNYAAVSAPRYMFVGVIVIYPTNVSDQVPSNQTKLLRVHDNPDNSPCIHQLGSYFGAALLSEDINGDGKTDLLVGAPLYSADDYDEGRVFVYVTGSEETSSIGKWENSSYCPQVLIGDNKAGERFGMSIASAGDLNNDGYNDVVIGAPFADDGRGAIYIYNGRASVTEPLEKTQKISASLFSGPSVNSFGFSIHGGMDVDENNYPDIFVGAPQSDAIFLFRARPFVSLTASLMLEAFNLNVITCRTRPNRNCITLKVCFEVNGTTMEDLFDVSYNTTVDASLQRFEFGEDETTTASGFPMLQSNILINSSRNSCAFHDIYVKTDFSNFLTPVDIELVYSLSETHTNRPLSSIELGDVVNYRRIVVEFERGCGNTTSCVYDLGLQASLQLPSLDSTSSVGSFIDFTENGSTLVITAATANQPLRVSINLTNNNAVAYQTMVTVTYPSILRWSRLSNVSGSSPSGSNCIFDEQEEEVTQGTITTKKLSYSYDDRVGNVFPDGNWCWFEINFSFNQLQLNGETSPLRINIEASAGGNFSDTDRNASNNDLTFDIPVKYRADISPIRGTAERLITVQENKLINTTFQLENQDSIDMTFNYVIKSLGYSRIRNSSISFMYPAFLTPNHPLLYLFEISCLPAELCSCNESVINPYGLGLNYSSTDSNFTLSIEPAALEQASIDCSAMQPSTECNQLICQVVNFDPNDEIELSLSLKFWKEAFYFSQNVSELVLTSELSYNSLDSPLVINRLNNSINLQFETTVDVRLEVDRINQLIPVDLICLIVIGASGGVVFMFIIVGLLYKCKFFERKFLLALSDDEWEGPRHIADAKLLNEVEEINKEDINHGTPEFVDVQQYDNIAEAENFLRFEESEANSDEAKKTVITKEPSAENLRENLA